MSSETINRFPEEEEETLLEKAKRIILRRHRPIARRVEFYVDEPEDEVETLVCSCLECRENFIEYRIL